MGAKKWTWKRRFCPEVPVYQARVIHHKQLNAWVVLAKDRSCSYPHYPSQYACQAENKISNYPSITWPWKSSVTKLSWQRMGNFHQKTSTLSPSQAIINGIFALHCLTNQGMTLSVIADIATSTGRLASREPPSHAKLYHWKVRRAIGHHGSWWVGKRWDNPKLFGTYNKTMVKKCEKLTTYNHEKMGGIRNFGLCRLDSNMAHYSYTFFECFPD